MAGIILRAGDFGQGSEVTFTADALYLPNPTAPDGRERVSVGDIAEIDDVADDNSGRLKSALNMSLTGAALLGPVGLAAGVLAVRKSKDVMFLVRLKDNRHFVAFTDARTYSDLRQKWYSARKALAVGVIDDDDGDAVRDEAIDRVLAKYIDAAKLPAGTPATAAAAPPAAAAASAGPAKAPANAAPAAPATATPVAAAPVASPTASPPPGPDRRLAASPGLARTRPAPIFGRRRTDIQ